MYFIIKLIERHHIFVKYCLVGGLSAVIDFLVLIFLIEFFQTPILLANSISFSLAVVNNYYFSRRFTFRNTNPQIGRQFILFFAGALVGLIINNGVLVSLVNIGMWYILAKILATGIALLWNYFINKKIIFA